MVVLKIELKERRQECDVPELGLASKHGLSKPEPLSTTRAPLLWRSTPVNTTTRDLKSFLFLFQVDDFTLVCGFCAFTLYTTFP